MICERDRSGNPFLWLGEAKATRKIGNGKPDLSLTKFSTLSKTFWRRSRPNENQSYCCITIVAFQQINAAVFDNDPLNCFDVAIQFVFLLVVDLQKLYIYRY